MLRHLKSNMSFDSNTGGRPKGGVIEIFWESETSKKKHNHLSMIGKGQNRR